MTPSQLSTQLRHIVAKISNSKSPRRDLVARDLKNLINKLAANDDIPNREPDEINDKFETKIWNLGGSSKFELDSEGTKRWYKNKELHREDGPAVIFSNGKKVWLKNGKRHREDGPAVEEADGTKFWYLDGKRHREDGPAAEYGDGKEDYYLFGISVDPNDFKSFTPSGHFVPNRAWRRNYEEPDRREF